MTVPPIVSTSTQKDLTMQKTFTLVVVAILFAVVEHASAQWPADSVAKITICNASGDQKYPEIASDGAGGAIIVWQDGRTSSKMIYAQRVDSAGVVKWAANGILVSNADNSQLPQIASDGAGGAYITWFDMRKGWPDGTVAVQRVTADGQILWTTNGVILDSLASSWPYPTIVSYGVGGAIVTWIGSNGEIFAQKVDQSGDLQWTSGRVQLAIAGGLPQITTDGAGGAIVAFYKYDPDARYTHVFAQRVNSSGLVLGSVVGDTICVADNYQHYPEPVPDGNGGAIIGWLDSRFSSESYVFAQRLGASGISGWQWNGTQVSTIQGYSRMKIASDGAGGAIFAWLGGNSSDVYVQRIDGSGMPQWVSPLRLTENTMPSIPRIIWDGVDGAYVIWEDGGLAKVRVQHVTAAGTLGFESVGRAAGVGSAMTSFFAATTDGTGRVIVTWEDVPNYDANIYTHRVVAPGFATGVGDDGRGGTGPRAFSLEQNYPNPFNPTTTIRYALPSRAQVLLTVYNGLGQRVAVLVQGEQDAGNHEAVFDAVGLASGVYLYRLQVGDFVQSKKLLLLQ